MVDQTVGRARAADRARIVDADHRLRVADVDSKQHRRRIRPISYRRHSERPTPAPVGMRAAGRGLRQGAGWVRQPTLSMRRALPKRTATSSRTSPRSGPSATRVAAGTAAA